MGYTENQFENDLIAYLSTGTLVQSSQEIADEDASDYISYVQKKKLWKYEENIKTTEDLWNNFKMILEQHNQSTLEEPLSVNEFQQVKRIISGLNTPYEAGQFLYGMNGVSQIEIDLDDGRHVFLTVFDQKQIGAGDTVYQVVNQIKREPVLAGKPSRRFDTTLLINGLPIIQIEEKTDTHDVDEALNQMHQYILEYQYGDIFSTLQILVAMTPYQIKYMANTTGERFNKDFAFQWQEKETNKVIRNWKQFADLFLSIPMAHQMATNYMILDGTKNKQTLKVMRPYQVYATQNVIEKLKHEAKFDIASNKIGYIWHTTGSGKTITSFKTAWLASRLPNVDKVIFVVDRIALTKQTHENYMAYNPDMEMKEEKLGAIQDTSNTNELSRRISSKMGGIIVTSVQKLDTLVKRTSFRSPQKNIVFIVDEAHRSTSGESFKKIQKSFKRAAWIGYTGTPMFDKNIKGLRTEDIFGPLLHAYTIREAIADKNVLGFKVDFQTTIPEHEMKESYLPSFYREKHPEWSLEEIRNKVENMTEADMDDSIEASFYDKNLSHVKLVVEDIYTHWRNRSNDGKYNALLTTHVGGGKASTPMAMMYFREFQRVNKEREAEGKFTLKVGITFSMSTNNGENMIEINQGLEEAMKVYNKEFETNYGLDNVSGYIQDLTSRLNRTATDKKFLDLVIVVDQLLTGFDAPELNTLYVDRSLKGASLIQAYSRTNRVADMQEKPWGRIVNYRWPSQNEKWMNEALATYANKDSQNHSGTPEGSPGDKIPVDLVAKKYEEVLRKVRGIVQTLRILSDDFHQVPSSERQQEEMYQSLKEYNRGVAQLKQYGKQIVNGRAEGFDYDNPDELILEMGMTIEEEKRLSGSLKNELKKVIVKSKEGVTREWVDLKMVHVKDVKVNYDYLTELVTDLLNQIHEKRYSEAERTKMEIQKFANGLEDTRYAKKIEQAIISIIQGDYKADKYPVKNLKNSIFIIEAASKINHERELNLFIQKQGLQDVITPSQLLDMFHQHRFGAKDLDDSNQLQHIISKASETYRDLATEEEVRALSKIKYRNLLRDQIYEKADEFSRD